MIPELRPHQQFAYDWLQSRPRAGLVLEQRLGKTPVALRDIKAPTNIICPAFLKLQWAEEVAHWRPDLRVRVIPSKGKPAPGGDVFIVNYEILQNCWLAALPNLIVDEGHYCKGYESKRTHTVMALAERARTLRWLSGTVMPSRSMELWPFLRATEATRMTVEDFGVRYAGGFTDQWGGWQFRGNTHSDELAALVAPRILRITRDQVGMLPNEWRVIALDQPIDARERAYSLQAIAANPTPVAFEGLADLLHFQGLAKVPEALAYVNALLDQNEGPLLIFAWHRDVVELLAQAMTARSWRVGVIVGGMADAKKQAVKNQFQAGELHALIGNSQAAGVGLPLHMAERVIFVEGRWTPGDMMQAADRGVSMDRPRSLRVDVLVVSKSIDEFMVRRCLEKTRQIDSIITPNEEFSQWQAERQPPHPAPPLSSWNWSLRSPFARLRQG